MTGPALLLLHGLGATGAVWSGLGALLDERWPGPWAAPDLPGHGAAARLPAYRYDALAAAVAAGAEHRDGRAGTVVLGHSLGGVLALELATGRHGLDVAAAVALGTKVVWTPDELARAAALAARPAAAFATRDEALARHLRVSGLAGLVDAGSPAATTGVVEEGGRWRLALDGAAFGVGEPRVAGLLAAARAPVVLARGERDPLVTTEQLRALRPDPVELPGAGHNAHVEDPEAVWHLIAPHAGSGRG